MSRTETRQQMIRERTYTDGVHCDLCRQLIHGLPQMHELIPRRLTIGSDEARELSFQPELCAILCADCHSIAEREENETRLWERNYQRYGKERVLQAFERLWNLWPVKVTLPEVNDDRV